MALRKRIADSATFKGKVTATTGGGGKVTLPTNNQSHTEDTDSSHCRNFSSMSNCLNNEKTNSFRCSTRWESKWRSTAAIWSWAKTMAL